MAEAKYFYLTFLENFYPWDKNFYFLIDLVFNYYMSGFKGLLFLALFFPNQSGIKYLK